jgi:hypothetical protein
MNERIKELAEQANMVFGYSGQLYGATDDLIERFAELVRQDEREKCAKLCEGLYSSGENNDKWTITRDMAIKDCIQAIRGRTE